MLHFIVAFSNKQLMGPPQTRKQKGKRVKKNKQRKSGIVGFWGTTTLFPPRRVGTMVYDALFNIAPAASAVAYNSYRANSVYDPDLTGVGTTASGYSNMIVVYNKYRVLHCRCDCTWSNSTVLPCVAFIIATPANTVGTSFPNIMAQKFVWSRPLGNSNGMGLTHSVGFRVSDIYGAREAAVAVEDDFAGVAGTNPNNVVYLHIGAMNSTSTAFATNIQLQVRLTFQVEWTLPVPTVP